MRVETFVRIIVALIVAPVILSKTKTKCAHIVLFRQKAQTFDV